MRLRLIFFEKHLRFGRLFFLRVLVLEQVRLSRNDGDDSNLKDCFIINSIDVIGARIIFKLF